MSRKFLIVVCVAALLAGCASGNRKAEEKPAELADIDNPIKIRKLWSVSAGADAEHLRLGLRPASDGTRVFVASYDGRVSGLDLVSGNRDWRAETGVALSAGPGYGDGLVVVGSTEGAVIAFEASDGSERWRQRVSGEILAAPAIGRNTVVVRTVNGALVALDADDGDIRWRHEQNVPRLTLRGTGRPAIGGDRVVSGFDNGRLVAIRLADGVESWQVPMGTPRGRTELERLADIDSDVVVINQEVYAAGYQGRAVLLSISSGQPVWAEDISSTGALAVDWTGVYVTAADGVVRSLDRATGTPRWSQQSLLRRGVTGPEAFGQSVVVGDFEGFVHWLSTDNGNLLGRARAGKAAIVMSPLAVGDRLVVQDEAGGVHAFALQD
ncbi:MAG: outer membrane protein assembly factor BamB [Gammaproteobacteria bacterium]|nr:outer membrane protein assembly factor BamB [Gammaproteobacteria bacterium]